jgi:hypothetical protein
MLLVSDLIVFLTIETFSFNIKISRVEAHSNIFFAAEQKSDLRRGAEPGIKPGVLPYSKPTHYFFINAAPFLSFDVP